MSKDGMTRHMYPADEQRLRPMREMRSRIEELEIAMRAALSFVQERYADHRDGHAQMVIGAMRGALRKDRD